MTHDAGEKLTQVTQGQQAQIMHGHLHGLPAGHATGGARRAAAETPPHLLRPTAPEFPHTVSTRSGGTHKPMQRAVPHTTHKVRRGVAHTIKPITLLGGCGALPTTLRAGAAAERHATCVRSCVLPLLAAGPRFWHTTSNRTSGLSRPIDYKNRSALLPGSYPSATLPLQRGLVWAVGGKPHTPVRLPAGAFARRARGLPVELGCTEESTAHCLRVRTGLLLQAHTGSWRCCSRHAT